MQRQKHLNSWSLRNTAQDSLKSQKIRKSRVRRVLGRSRLRQGEPVFR